MSSLFWPAALLCVVAQAMVVRSLLLGRTPGAVRTVGGQVREAAWVLIPAVVLGITLFLSWGAMRRIDRTASAGDAVVESAR